MSAVISYGKSKASGKADGASRLDDKDPAVSAQADKVEHPEPQDDFSTTQHVLNSVDGALAYTATIGRIVLHEEVTEDDKFQGRKPKAELSITSYTLDPKPGETIDVTKRPVVFAFNGGPGSSSVWLHLGLLGPRRVDSGDVGALTPPPYGLLDNPETLLRVADLVFIDPISTGYSRAVEGESAKPYHGFQGDIELVAEVIRLWTTRNGRWMSPKYILGESYGGTRGGGLVDYLQNRFGMNFNGVIMIAPALNTETFFHSEHSDLPYPLNLPAQAAVAHYHGKLPDKTLEQAVADADAYVDEYRNLLAKGHNITPEERAAAIAKLSSIIAIRPEYIDQANLRVSHMRFLAELLRDQRKVVGRLDARFTGPSNHYTHEYMTPDPFNTATEGAFTAAWNHYVNSELDYHHEAPYETSTDKVRPWSYKEFEGKAVDVADRLTSAMIKNPFLQLHVALGRYDAGVPKEAVEYSLNHLAIPYEDRDRIETITYPAGHMMYLHQPSRIKQLDDIAAFIKRSSNR